jgi:hypothetical protein
MFSKTYLVINFSGADKNVSYNSNLIDDGLDSGFSLERIRRFMVRRRRRLVVGWTERDFHELQAQVRSLFRVLERPQLEGRLRHDLQLPQRV